MLSTGNDIISLGHVNMQRTRHVQFYDKILSEAELALYNTEAVAEMPFELFVWLAWSVKESAFKYMQRNIPDLLFSPLKINIRSIKFPASHTISNFGRLPYEATSFPSEVTYNSTVKYGDAFFYSRSIIHHELIHSVVNKDESFGNIWWGIKAIEYNDHKNQSAEVRSFLLQKLNSVLPGHKLTIGKSPNGYPVILNETSEIDIPVSFTHHHHFIAYSFLLSKNQAIGYR